MCVLTTGYQLEIDIELETCYFYCQPSQFCSLPAFLKRERVVLQANACLQSVLDILRDQPRDRMILLKFCVCALLKELLNLEALCWFKELEGNKCMQVYDRS